MTRTAIFALRAARQKLAANIATQERLLTEVDAADQLRAIDLARADDELKEIRTLLFSQIEDVPRSLNLDQTYVEGIAELVFSNWTSGQARKFLGWDVFASTTIHVGYLPNSGNQRYRSATLIYVDQLDGVAARWCEVAFQPIPDLGLVHPFGILHQDWESFQTDHAYKLELQIAYGPTEISGSNQTEFIDRWTLLFAQALLGELYYKRRAETPRHDEAGTTQPSVRGG
jgi:hypothetical protein